MTSRADVWQLFIGDGLAIAGGLAGATSGLKPEVPEQEDLPLLDRLASQAFSIAAQALMVGASDVGQLALAIEKVLDGIADGSLNPAYAVPLVASSADTLRKAFEILADPDTSGARIEGPLVDAARFELESLLPAPDEQPGAETKPTTGYDVPAASVTRRPPRRTVPPTPLEVPPSPETTSADTESVPPSTAPQTWEPTVDADMVELFFDEVAERLDGLAVKMLEIEGRPDDEELIRDIFRDMHTVKGSSAMVGLKPMNDIAHAAEDLVGQIREKTRSVDAPLIDALLASLDALRAIANLARAGSPLDIDTNTIVQRLRDPRSAVPAVAQARDAASSQPTNEPSTPAKKAERTVKQTIRVDFDKLDRLMNLVGELVLGRDGLSTAIRSVESVTGELGSDRGLGRRQLRLAEGTAVRQPTIGDELRRVERVLSEITTELEQSSDQIESVSSELREQVMKLRMIPVGGIFRKHHRTVRDLANNTGKNIKLVTVGEDTELDKLLVESLDEPLVHLIRNAVDHGIELPSDRLAAGKSEQGTITLSARHQGNQVVVQIADDGGGIDPNKIRNSAIDKGIITAEAAEHLERREILELIFASGFSTAEAVSDLSGRGVGMDVVKQTIMLQLKGSIDIDSEQGSGTTFTLRLPLTLAIIQVLLARSGGEVFAIPIDSVVRTITRSMAEVQQIGTSEFIEVREVQIPLIATSRVLGLEQVPRSSDQLHIVLCDYADERFGLVCDALIEKKEIVIKPLGDLLEGTPCAAGATLLGDRPIIILDVPAIIRRAQKRGSAGLFATEQRATVTERTGAEVLLVEDSEVIRESLRRLLTAAGYRVTTARDGVEGFELAQSRSFDLVSTDVMMPRMDGYELTRRLREHPVYRDVPIVMVTSRGERIDRVRGFDAGVDEYITKPHDRHLLVHAIRKLLGEEP